MDTAFTTGLQAFHKRSRTFGGFPSKVPFRMSTAETLVIPSSDRTLYGESAAPRKPSVVCLLSHQDISAYRGPGLHSRISLHLQFQVLGARSVNELMGVHTHAYPGAVCRWTRQSLDQLGSISPFMLASLCRFDWEDLLVYEFCAHQECTPRSWTCRFYQNSMAFFSGQIVYSTLRFGHTAQGYNLRRTRGKARPVPSSRPMLCWIDLDPDIRHQYSDVHQGTNSKAHTSVWRLRSRRR